MKKIFSFLICFICLIGFNSCNIVNKNNDNEQLDNKNSHGYNGAAHSLIVKENQDATCQKEGYQIIGCASCDWVYRIYVLPIVPCLYENGICKWCGRKNSDYDF